jgi:hypothetical protein
MRQTMSVGWGDPYVLPGGMGVGFATSLELRMFSMKPKLKEKDKESIEVPREVEIGVVVTKSKVSVPFVEGGFVLNTKTAEVNDMDLLFRELLNSGIVRKDGSSYVVEGYDMKTKTQSELIEKINKDRELMKKLWNEVIERRWQS